MHMFKVQPLKEMWCIYPRHIHNIMSVCITQLYKNIPIHKKLTHTDQSQHPKICIILFYDYYESSYYKIPDSSYYGDWPVPGNCLVWLPWDSRDPPVHLSVTTPVKPHLTGRQAESVWHLADSRLCHTAVLPIGCSAAPLVIHEFNSHTTLLLLLSLAHHATGNVLQYYMLNITTWSCCSYNGGTHYTRKY